MKLWDVERARSWRDCPTDFGISARLVFSPDGQTLVTVEMPRTATREFPVRTWKLSDDRRRVTLVESLRRDQLHAASAPGAGRPARSPGRSAVRRRRRDSRGRQGFRHGRLDRGPREIRLYGRRAAIAMAVMPSSRDPKSSSCPATTSPKPIQPGPGGRDPSARPASSPGRACPTDRPRGAGPLGAILPRWPHRRGPRLGRGPPARPHAPDRRRHGKRSSPSARWGTCAVRLPFGFHPEGDAVVIGGIGHAAGPSWDFRVGESTPSPSAVTRRKSGAWRSRGRTDEAGAWRSGDAGRSVRERRLDPQALGRGHRPGAGHAAGTRGDGDGGGVFARRHVAGLRQLRQDDPALGGRDRRAARHAGAATPIGCAPRLLARRQDGWHRAGTIGRSGSGTWPPASPSRRR